MKKTLYDINLESENDVPEINTRRSPVGSELVFSPQCSVCGTPLSGFVSYIFRLAGISRSTRNPNICSRCNSHIKEGRIVELSVLFADLSKFTELTHDLGAERTHEVVTAFLDQATTALLKHGAFIDRYIGDAVMALFNVPVRQEDHSAQAVAAAIEIQAGLDALRKRFNLDLNSSVGIATGWARVGTIGSAVRKDYSAIGEVVNLAARLEGQARPGEVLVQDNIYEKIAGDFPNACAETLTLKGFRDQVVAYSLGPCAVTPRWTGVARRPQLAARIALGGVIFALLGAPCAAGTLIGPLALGMGIGTTFGTAMTYWAVFDKPVVQYPLFSLAIMGSLANLYTIWRARKLRKQSEEGTVATTRFARYRPAVVTALSVATLLLVAYELYLHAMAGRL